MIELDIEGHEKETLLGATRNSRLNTDAQVEIGSAENATSIYSHFTTLGVRFLLQKKAWRTVKAVDDTPFNYKEGSVFLSWEKEMSWR